MRRSSSCKNVGAAFRAASFSLRVAVGLLLSVGSAVAAPEVPDLGEARKLLKNNQPEQASSVIKQLQATQPDDPWLVYDLGVTAYAAGDYDKAEAIWQELATRQLPLKLRDQTWAQIGNVSFRKGEPFEPGDPQTAVQFYEQSREAYRISLVSRPKDKVVRYNLKVVELKLARLHASLAKQLLEQVNQKQPLDKQIPTMQAALDHQRTAQNLVPEEQQYQEDVKKTEQELSQKFTQKAAQEEKRADSTLAKTNPNSWELKNATEKLREALSDFQEAESLDPQNTEAQTGEERVKEKLAELLAKEGKQQQQEAEQTAKANPEEGIDKYEQALEKYEQALALDEDQPQATKGEQEVREALEQLHMQQGDRMAQEGRQDMEQKPAEAAEELMSALNHYQEALELNPENQEAPPKIAALENTLPALLNELGQQEQQQAAEQENRSIERAIGHLEKAATSFQMSQEIQADNPTAQQGEEQARQDLARLRQQLAQRNQQQAQQNQNQNKNQNDQENQESFNAMLSRVKNAEKQREYEQARRAPTTKYDPDQDRIYKNW